MSSLFNLFNNQYDYNYNYNYNYNNDYFTQILLDKFYKNLYKVYKNYKLSK